MRSKVKINADNFVRRLMKMCDEVSGLDEEHRAEVMRRLSQGYCCAFFGDNPEFKEHVGLPTVNDSDVFMAMMQRFPDCPTHDELDSSAKSLGCICVND